MSELLPGSVESQKEIGDGPRDVVRRWLMEIKLASKAEKDWRDQSGKVIDRYRGKKAKKNSYNILWANTELLRPSIYSQSPKPDVRRRFKDKDPTGKLMGDVLTRSLEYSLQVYDFDAIMKMDVLDVLLAGRGVSRVRYVPTFKDGDESEQDELEWEHVACEHVQWDDFRHGPGKTWNEVMWVAYRHRMTRDQLKAQFGEEISQRIVLDSADDDDVKRLEDSDKLSELFKTCEVWELWDKEGEKVYFVSESYKSEPLKVVDDPLGIDGFYPSPRPLYAIEDTSSLVPLILYDQYSEQADELDRISTRINKIIDACKVRGIYDATISEFGELMKGQDNDLIPAQNVTALLERGGLEKAVWTLPIDLIVNVLRVLYEQREATKAVIYEITGISDVARGSSNPNETLGAQQLKANFGSLRLQKLQREAQRYARDLVVIMGQIIAEKFQQPTFMKMTGLPIPTDAQVHQQMMQAQLQYQQQAMQAQASGQPPPPSPQPPQVVTWEQVISQLRDNATRSYKIDIETDSTISADLEAELNGIQTIVQGIVQLVEGLAPAVQAGAFPIEAVKEIIGAMTRRAKMGNAVEDALDAIQAPQQPQADPKAQQAQADLQKGQQALQQGQQDLQQQQMKVQQQQMQQDYQAKTAELQAQVDQLTHVGAMQKQEAALQLREAQLQLQEQMQRYDLAQAELAFKKWQVELSESTKVVVAQIAAKAASDAALMKAEQTADARSTIEP